MFPTGKATSAPAPGWRTKRVTGASDPAAPVRGRAMRATCGNAEQRRDRGTAIQEPRRPSAPGLASVIAPRRPPGGDHVALSAAANSAAVANRSAGSLASAVSTASSTCGGNRVPLRRERRGRLGHHLRDDRLRGGAGERRLAGAASRTAPRRASRCRCARRSPARPSPARDSCTAACRGTCRSRSSGCRRPC